MKLNDAISIAVRLCMTSALEQANGNVCRASAALGVHRTQFYKLAARHGVLVRAVRSVKHELHA